MLARVVYDYGEIATWTVVWLYLVFVSLVVHEAGHYLVGLHYGWQCAGIKLRYLMVGGGVQMGTMEPDPGKARVGMVAIAGPLGSLVMTLAFLALAQLPINHNFVFGGLALFNFAVFVVNLLPLPITDGGTILWAVTGWRPKWRYFFGGWAALELISLFVVLVYSWRG